MSIAVSHNKNTCLLLPQINQHLSRLLKNDWFEIEFWQKNLAVTGSSQGRSTTWFIGHENDEWVLRHYHRGGWMAKIMADRYFYFRPKTTRCFAELALLETMYQQGLPVPKPIAARFIKRGLIYRADLLIEKIPRACDLVAHLQKEKLSEANWHAVGSMIAKFHEAGIFHADLNAHNILVDDTPEFWLIDFDKCRRLNPEDKWQQANLDRLHRSFVKESKRHSLFYFDEQCWHWLISGYQSFYHLSPNARH